MTVMTRSAILLAVLSTLASSHRAAVDILVDSLEAVTEVNESHIEKRAIDQETSLTVDNEVKAAPTSGLEETSQETLRTIHKEADINVEDVSDTDLRGTGESPGPKAPTLWPGGPPLSSQPQKDSVNKFYEAQRARTLIKAGFTLPTSFLRVGKDQVCKKLMFFSDLEGNWDAWKKLVKFSGALQNEALQSIDEDFTALLQPGYCLVYGGDSLDSNNKALPTENARPVSITKELVKLAQDNPNRVVLILGNRDLNKLRLKTELAPTAEPGNFRYYWTAANEFRTNTNVFEEKETWPTWTTENHLGERLANIMEKSMGAKIDGLQKDLHHNFAVPDTPQDAAMFVRDTLLSPGGENNWYFRYLQMGVVLGAAQFDSGKYALSSHTGLHPFMFNVKFVEGKQTKVLTTFPRGSLMVPTSAGLLKKPQNIGEWKQEDVVPGLDFALKTEDRVAVARDLFQYTKEDLNIETWVAEYAAWKQTDFLAWASSSADKGQAGVAWTGATRPGLQLMDAGVGNLAGIFRNAGFTVGGPCTAWQYGINPGQPNTDPKDLFYKAPETYEAFATLDEFGRYISRKHNVAFTFNGHFTVPQNELPLQFQAGAEDGSVTTYNHNLSKADFNDQASFSMIDSDHGDIVSTFYWNHKEGFKRMSSPRESGSRVGQSYTVPKEQVQALKGKCSEDNWGLSPVRWNPDEDVEYHAYIQDQRAAKKGKTSYVLKMLPNKGVVYILGKAEYCVVQVKDFQQLCAHLTC